MLYMREENAELIAKVRLHNEKAALYYTMDKTDQAGLDWEIMAYRLIRGDALVPLFVKVTRLVNMFFVSVGGGVEDLMAVLFSSGTPLPFEM